jgi:hypothetical protein
MKDLVHIKIRGASQDMSKGQDLAKYKWKESSKTIEYPGNGHTDKLLEQAEGA